MKIALMFLAAAALTLVSCNTEILDDPAGETPEPVTGIVFNLAANHPDGAATKAVQTGWESGDVIFVFFDNVAAPRYLKMSYDGTRWSYTQMNGTTEETLGLTEGASGNMRAVYLPFGNELSVEADGTAFTFSETTCSYYLTATLAYTVAEGKVSGTFDMRIPEGYIQFFLDDEDASSSTAIELREPHLTPQGIASIAADGTITHTNVAHGAPLKGYVYNKIEKVAGESAGYLFSGILASDARNTATDYHFTLVIGGFSGNYFHKEFSEKTFYRGESDGRALKLPVVTSWTAYTDFIPVDLGCDSHLGGTEYKRIYWANRNVGATADTGTGSYGDFFAWGELEPYYEDGYARETPGTNWKAGKEEGYAWGSYTKFNPSGDGATFTKYTGDTKYNGDNYDTLQPEDDAATQILGDPWRMPTKTDWRCLYWTLEDEDGDGFVGESVSDILTWTFNSEGTVGYTVTSSAAGCEGNSIFLPLAGRRRNLNLYDYKSGREGGNYWSSTHWRPVDPSNTQSESQYAFGASIDRPSDTGQGPLLTGNLARYTGRTIRPVMD